MSLAAKHQQQRIRPNTEVKIQQGLKERWRKKTRLLDNFFFIDLHLLQIKNVLFENDQNIITLRGVTWFSGGSDTASAEVAFVNETVLGSIPSPRIFTACMPLLSLS